MSKVKLIGQKKEYIIIESENTEDLCFSITKHLNTGKWFLVGGPYGFYNPLEDCEIHCQALVKISENVETKNVTKLKLTPKGVA